MKLSKYFEKLKEILEEHGDLDLIYSSDDEGNVHDKVRYLPTIVYAEQDGNHYSTLCEEDFEDDEYDKEDYEKVVCVN